MGDAIALRLLLAFFTSVRLSKGRKAGVDWCSRNVGGMHEVLKTWGSGIAHEDNSAAVDRLNKYCRTCGGCKYGRWQP